MASLGTIVNRFVGVAELADSRANTGVDTWTRTDAPRLRPFANEDVYLFVKRIDNAGVIRAADPAAKRARTGSVATAFAAAILMIAGLAPAAYDTMAGFTLERLHQEQIRLQKEKTTLDREEAELLSTSRLEQLATSLKMEAPGPQAIRYIDEKAPREARNRIPNGNGAGLAR